MLSPSLTSDDPSACGIVTGSGLGLISSKLAPSTPRTSFVAAPDPPTTHRVHVAFESRLTATEANLRSPKPSPFPSDHAEPSHLLTVSRLPPTKNSVSPQLTAVAPSTSAKLSPPYGFVAATLVASAKAPKFAAVKETVIALLSCVASWSVSASALIV